MSAPTPPRLLPMLAGRSGIPPDPEAWQLEPKFDGQRVMATVAGGTVLLANRKGLDATGVYPELQGLSGALDGHAAVLDGEAVTFNAEGQTSFQRLQRRMHVVDPPPRLLAEVPVVFVAFDVLWLDGELVVDRPQWVRRQLLESLAVKGPSWQTAPVLDATPDELLEACRQLGLEGFMAKRRDAAYHPGRRSPAWSKVRCGRRREFVVGGWTPGKAGRTGSIGSLAVGAYDVGVEEGQQRGTPPRLFYVGQVGSGLTENMIAQLQRLFTQIATPTSPFANPTPRDVSFVHPALVVEVAYSEITEAGTVRQPSLKGLRTDVEAREVLFDDDLRDRFGGST